MPHEKRVDHGKSWILLEYHGDVIIDEVYCKKAVVTLVPGVVSSGGAAIRVID